ncbi:hypothetical protein [Lysobacter terrae]
MQIPSGVTVLAVALLASVPLLAAGSGTSAAGTDASKQETEATTQQDNCTLPALPSTEFSPAGLSSLLPKPGSTPPDPAEVDRLLRKAEACARAAGLRAPGEGTTSSTTDWTSNRATATQASSSTGS